MTVDPRPTDTIASSIQDSLEGKIVKLTSFIEESFNDIWINAFGEELHEAEVKLLAAQLSGWVDYAGNSNLDQTDLERLGVSEIDPEEINQHMEDEQLDFLAPIVGISRDMGSRATGQITIETATDQTEIPENMIVATQPDTEGNYLQFAVDANSDGEIDGTHTVTPDAGNTEVTVDIIATNVGEEYNVAAGSITYLPNPPTGVEGVTNTVETSGGSDVQSNESFRQDIKNAVFESSGGGTRRGMIGYIGNNVSGVDGEDVQIIEFKKQQPPYVDVVVDGGSDGDVLDAIENSRPTGIEHNLVRPTVANLNIRAEISGSDIDTEFISDRIVDYLTLLGLGNEFRRSKLSSNIISSDDDIDDIESLSVSINKILNEQNTYDSTKDTYEFEYAPLGAVRREERYYDGNDSYELLYGNVDATSTSITAIVDGLEVTLSESDGDYSVADTTSDKIGNDTIIFENTSPDNGTTFEIEYNTTSSGVISVEDSDGNSYGQSTDFITSDEDGDGLIDSLTWVSGGNSPDDGQRWSIDYAPARTVSRDLRVSDVKKSSVDMTVGNAMEGFPRTVPEGEIEVEDEEHEFVVYNYEDGSSKTVYTYVLDKAPISSVRSVTGVVDGSQHVFEEGTDYTVVDDDGDGDLDSVKFESSGTVPDENTVFQVTYVAESIISRYVGSHSEETSSLNDLLDDVEKSHYIDNNQSFAGNNPNLDRIGALFGEIGKRRGRSDQEYRALLKSIVQSFNAQGTVSGLRFAIAAGAGTDPSNVIVDEDFDQVGYNVFIDDPDVQLEENVINNMADLADPSGVELLNNPTIIIDGIRLPLTLGAATSTTVSSGLGGNTLTLDGNSQLG